VSSQTATILVTDLVGSTERRVALGEERAEELRRTHDRLLAEAVTGNGGTVVKGLGDGVLAMFAGAAEAVGAAVAIQQAVALHVRRHPEDQLSVRIGLSSGDVTLEDDDCFGTPVVEASRLCADAAGEEILVADLVRLLARGRGDHQFVPAGERSLKGLPDPVPVAVVRWSVAAPDAPPLPSGLRTAQWFSFAGRMRERDALVERWKAAVAGDPALVMVSGEPGIGKTRLVAEVAAFAHEAGATVLYGRSEEELDVAFRPWAEALQDLVLHLPDEVLAAHVAEWGGDITRLVPSVDAPEPHRTDADTERLRLFGATADLLRRAGEDAPILLVLDDLHWADESSLLLLRHLVRQQADARVLLVGTYRDTDLSRSHPLAAALADLRREAAVERIDLAGLDRDEVSAFLTQAGGDDVLPEQVEDLAELVFSETEGNPFFLGEVLAHLVESGALVRREGRWESDRGLIEQIGLPEGIREVIGRRLAEVPEASNDVLRAAAVVGASFDAAVVADALEQDVDEVIAILEEAMGRRLVVEEGAVLDRFRFAHALVRQTLLEELRTSRRVRLHHRVALALEARGASSADLAFHFGEAVALADAGKAVDYAALAATEAADRLAFEQAVHFRRRALEAEELLEPADAARRSGVLRELGETQNLAGHPLDGRAAFVAAAAAAREAGRPDLLARAAFGYAGEAAPWIDWGDLVGPALAEEALDSLGPEPTKERAWCLSKRAHWHLFDADPAEMLRLARDAVEVAETTGDLACRLDTLQMMAQALCTVGETDQLVQVAAQEATLAEDPHFMSSLYHRAGAAYIANDMDTVREVLAWVASTDSARIPIASRWNFTLGEANLAINDGRWDDVAAPPAGTLEAFGATGPAVPVAHQMELHRRRGDLATSAAFQRRLVEEHGDVTAAWPNPAFADWLEGNREAAADGYRAWHRDVLPFVPAIFRVHAAAFVAPVAVDLGLNEMYDDLAEVLRPRRGQRATWSIEIDNGLVDHHLGVLDHAAGRVEEGLEELRTAVADYGRAGSRSGLALALADLAVLADDTEARAEALEVATELGMEGVLVRLGP
jgi:class 3 adenylate cyclase